MSENIYGTIKSNSGTFKSCLELGPSVLNTRWTRDCKTAPHLHTAGLRPATNLIRNK